MQPKVIQTSTTKNKKTVQINPKTTNLISNILNNNNELSKHKSYEIYNQYSPTNIAVNNKSNNTKRQQDQSTTIKQNIQYSGVKPPETNQNIPCDEKILQKKKNTKSKDIDFLEKKMPSNDNEKKKSEKNSKNIKNISENSKNFKNTKKFKNDLGNILSESDSFQEIDSMEEDSITKSTGPKILPEKKNEKESEKNYKRHLTTGYKKTKEKNNAILLKNKTLGDAQQNYIDINFNDNNNESDDEIIVNDNEFENSRSIQHDKLHETKFPKLSANPFIGDVLPEGNNNNTYSIHSSIKKIENNSNNNNNSNNETHNNKNNNIDTNNNDTNNNDPNNNDTNNNLNINKLHNNNRSNNNNSKKESNKSNHHIKSSTLGTFNKSSTNPNSSNLSNTIDGINTNTINTLSKKEAITNHNQENKYKTLLLLAKRGDREKFLEVLGQILSLPKEQVNINYQDEMGYSALHYSCDEGNQKIVEILLKANCEPNIRTNENKTPLHLTSRRGYFDISKLLVENGALLNVYDVEKNSPLHYVCMFNYAELLKYFLTKLPQADAKNNLNKTPLELTTNKEMKLLLENYLKKNEYSYHKIKIYHTSDSKMKNMLENYNNDDNLVQNNNNNMNTQANTNENNNTKSNKVNSSPSNNKSPQGKLRSYNNKKKNYNSINEQTNQNSNINKNIFTNLNNKNNNNSSCRDDDLVDNKNITINTSSLRNTNNTYINNNVANNNILNNSSNNYSMNAKYNTSNNNSNFNNSSLLKKNELKNNIRNKDNPLLNIQKTKKENKNQKNKKVLIQDITNSSNSLFNTNNLTINGLKKTRTLDQFASVNHTYNYNYNFHNNIGHYNIATNESRISTNANIHLNNTTIKNAKNNKSFNNSNGNCTNNIKKSQSINREKKTTNKNFSENKSKLLGNNLKNKTLFIDSVDLSNNNINNLNKTEESINILTKVSRFSRTSLKKTKNENTTKNKTNMNINNNNINNSNIANDKEKGPSTSRTKKKKTNKNTSTLLVDNNPNNLSSTNYNNNNMIDSFNRSNIVDQTLAENIHTQLTLNSIEEERITPSSFVCLALLGKGSFGEVYLVQKINTQEKFAMKVLRKERIMGQNLLKYAMAERNVLSLSNHPFIVKLNFAFQTSSKLFLILEYCSGGDLSKHLFFEKRFDEARAKFYICEVLLALENLHKRDIIFRDLKPDNVVLDEEGHCKLTDFGLSKEGVYDSQSAKSFCGSIAYLAPEMLKKQGHGKAVDWYLLGVLLYEMLVGITPYFTGRKEDIFHNIEYGELKIPGFISEDATSLLRGLLQRDPNKRLGGSSKDAVEIKQHPFFKDVNWDDVYHKRIPAPQINNYSNKIMHVYHRPRLFANDEYLNNTTDKPNPNILPGWSFINNDEL